MNQAADDLRADSSSVSRDDENTSKLYSKERPKAEAITFAGHNRNSDNAREFEHAGKRYKIAGQQGSVHEGDSLVRSNRCH